MKKKLPATIESIGIAFKALAIVAGSATWAYGLNYDTNGWFVKSQPPHPTTITIKNGATIPFNLLPAPWNSVIPTNQGPGRFGFEYAYADKVYGYAWFNVDVQGNATLSFHFSNSTNSPLKTCAAAIFNNKSGKRVFGVATSTAVNGYGTINNIIPIGKKTHTATRPVNFTQPPKWWSEVESITIRFDYCSTEIGNAFAGPDPLYWFKKLAGSIQNENLMVY